MEELKKLVRHWKLHEARGFWKMHPQKEDLVYALLEYMDDKDDYSRKAPTRPLSSKPSKDAPKVKTRKQSTVDLKTFRVSVLKPYAGDLFSQRDHTQGLIYLSRQNLRSMATAAGAGAGAAAGKANARNRSNTFLSGDFFQMGSSTVSAAAQTPEEMEATARQKARWQAIIVEIFRYSTIPGDEAAIIEEGGLQVVDLIGKTDLSVSSFANTAMAACCAATIVNLAVEHQCHAKLMPPNQMVVIEALNTIATHHALQARVMTFCCLALAHLSSGFGKEDAMVNMCLNTLAAGAASVDAPHCRKVAVAALANLALSSERNQLVEHLVPAIKALALLEDDHADAPLLVILATTNLSFFDVPRIALTDGGIVGVLATCVDKILAAVDEPAPKDGEVRAASAVAADTENKAVPMPGTVFGADVDAVLHAVSECLLNLSCTVDARERMVKDGGVRVMVKLEQKCKRAVTKEVLALALSNMTGGDLHGLSSTAVDQGAIPALVRLSKMVRGAEARGRLAAALCNFSADACHRAALVEEGAHFALVDLSASEPTASPTQPLVLVALINLLAVPANQTALVDAGMMRLLRRLAGAADAAPETERYCSMALANIADDLQLHSTETHQQVLSMMTNLAAATRPASGMPERPGAVELQRIIANAFAFFAHIMTRKDDALAGAGLEVDVPNDDGGVLATSTSGLLTDAVVRTIVQLCASKDGVVMHYAGVALHNLAQAPAFHARLVANGITDALALLAEARDDSVRRMCASTLRSVTAAEHFKLVSKDVAVVDGLVKVLRSLESSRAPDIINSSAAALFAISCSSDALLQRDASILWRLFGMMRGGEESTQLYAARALCNLTCAEATVATLLRDQAIADFIAIAILRTNNEEVKGVCAECLFNMLRYPASRPALLKEPNNVLWAISRLFRSVESGRTQRIGALVVYNLSCAPATAAVLMETINAAETLASVALTPGHESNRWAAAALCNLSSTSDFATKLVHDAAHTHQRPNQGTGTDDDGRGLIRVVNCLLAAAKLEHARADAHLADKAGAEEIRMLCTRTLYNLARVSADVSERLIDDGIIALMESFLLDDDDDQIVELACAVFYNVSAIPGCEVAMVDFQAVSSLMKVLRRRVLPAEALAAAAPMDVVDAGADSSRTMEDVPRNETKFPLANVPAFDVSKSALASLCFATFFNFSTQAATCTALQAAGVGDACIALAALPQGVPKPLHRVALRIFRNLATGEKSHKLLAARGRCAAVVAALRAWTRIFAADVDALNDVAAVVAHLSCTASLADGLVESRGVLLLAECSACLAGTVYDEQALGLLALAARNVSPRPQKAFGTFGSTWSPTRDAGWHDCAVVVGMLRALTRVAPVSTEDGSETDEAKGRLEDAAACLYNVLTTVGAALECADVLSALLTALFRRCDKSPATRALCAAALIARQTDPDAEAGVHYSDGSVVALHSAMNADVAQLDADTVSAPKRQAPARRADQKPALNASALSPHFSVQAIKAVAGGEKAAPPFTVASSRADQSTMREPQWLRFAQDQHKAEMEGLDAPTTASVKLPKQSAEPPKSTYTKTSGKFRKICLKRNKVKAAPAQPDAAEGDVGFDVKVEFDMAQAFKPLAG
ncbi:armadillo-type protein [Pelagophyceae sp. CCMP2097]|nr:armadillo-type protein [Pelagophyceae sp. CCMP2097]